jgi:hypothetical protein
VEEDPLMPSTVARFESSGFLPVGTPKTLVYAAPGDNEEAIHHRIVDACGLFAAVIIDMMKTSEYTKDFLI